MGTDGCLHVLCRDACLVACVSLSLYEEETERRAQPQPSALSLSLLICTDYYSLKLTVSDQC